MVHVYTNQNIPYSLIKLTGIGQFGPVPIEPSNTIVSIDQLIKLMKWTDRYLPRCSDHWNQTLKFFNNPTCYSQRGNRAPTVGTNV